MSSHGSYQDFDRGRGTGSWRGTNLSQAGPPQNLPPAKPLGPTVDSINIKTLLTEEVAPTIKNVEYVVSYNWISEKSPVILVPGQLLSCQLSIIKPIERLRTHSPQDSRLLKRSIEQNSSHDNGVQL